MRHLVKDFYVDADRYCFIIIKKSVGKTGKGEGQEKETNWCYPATISSVETFIANEGAKEWVNGDWNRMKEYIDTALTNFREALPELVKKRYT